MVDVYGVLLCGRRFCQSAGRSFAVLAIALMSSASASVTTSASSPSMTERACLPEPPCDCRIVTFSLAFACQCLANAGLNSWYSSRVGSYETLSSVTSRGGGDRRREAVADKQ